MRLTVLPLQQITPELCQDLTKLPLPDAVQEVEAWLQQLIDDESRQCWLARFNDKYIGLLVLSMADVVTVEWLVVREATRRRGVGRYLLEQAEAQYEQTLVVRARAGEPPQLQRFGFLTALGFAELEDGCWQRPSS
ncbi:PanM family protein [Neiella marina]|uniref:PanM family protein n=1 Tax=Neiella holothuriorum TaxID=2870530 RepID=A0ABS7EIV0_9GAMM|nr:acetyl-CoA sensor PanZ family protein [Neiella holothuriorum]MBW8192283.1 PanM family protein [Neiella holothuriorum]